MLILQRGIRKKRTIIARERPLEKSKLRRSKPKELEPPKREQDSDKKQTRNLLMMRRMRMPLRPRRAKKSQLRKKVVVLMRKTDQRQLKNQSL